MVERDQRGNHAPDGWQHIRLSELLAAVQAGFACGERDPDGVVQLRMNNVDTRGNFVWDEFIRVPATPEMVDAYRLRPGDMLFNNTNSVELVGKSAMFQGHDEPVVFSNHFTRLLTEEELLDPGFLAAWLNHEWYRGTFAAICNRWIGQSAVKADKLLSLDIPIPTLGVQKRIVALLAEHLAAVEQAREAATARLEAAGSLCTALARGAFISDDARAWASVPLGEIAEITSGIQKSPDRLPRHNYRKYLTVRNVQRGYLDLTKVERFEVTDAEIERLRLVDDDLLIVEGNGSVGQIGRNALFVGNGDEWIHQNHIIRVRLHLDTCLHTFASFYLNSDQGREQMVQRAQTTSGLYTLSSGKVASLEIPLPPIDRQQEIVDQLGREMAQARRITSAAEGELDAISRLPAAILRRAFAGEL